MHNSEYVLIFLAIVVLILMINIQQQRREIPPSGQYVIEIPNFLSDFDCDRLIESSQKIAWEESQVSGFTEKESAYIDYESRKSEQTWFSKGWNQISDKILYKTKNFLATYGLDCETFDYEDIQIARYKPGGYYLHHFDGDDCTTNCPTNQRIATMLVYLKAPDDGGETDFPELKLSTKPEKGKAVFFWVSDPKTKKLFKQTLHAGMPVRSGEKIIATQWVRGK